MLEPKLQRRPGAEAQVLYAQMLLAVGRLKEGWHHNEFRWMTSTSCICDPIRTARLEWPGPAGKDDPASCGAGTWRRYPVRTLRTAHQGLGRYCPSVGTAGAAGADAWRCRHRSGTCSRRRRSVPDFDYYAHLLSLPNVFGTDWPRFRPRLLSARGSRTRRALVKTTCEVHEFSVGLVWAGNPMHPGDRYRSMSLGTMAPLGTISGVVLLPAEGCARGRCKYAAGRNGPGLAPELDDLSETAAVISQLDLVICVDTAVAHLAGALGKPVWLMIARSCDWRWLEGRDDSPWYPSARLFRQTRRGAGRTSSIASRKRWRVRVRDGGLAYRCMRQ